MLKFIPSSAAILLALIISAPIKADTISNLVLNLDAPPANEFQVDVTVDVGIFTSSDTQTVVYSGLVRPEIEANFSDFRAPIVESVNFLGQPGDIELSDTVFNLGAIVGTVTLQGVRGRVETRMPPSIVTGGLFDGEEQDLIAAQGAILFSNSNVDDIDLSVDPLVGSFQGQNNSMIGINFLSVSQGDATYEVTVSIPVENVEVVFDDPDIDDVLDIVINGTLTARGTFVRAIPEPSSILVFIAIGSGCLYRRKR